MFDLWALVSFTNVFILLQISKTHLFEKKEKMPQSQSSRDPGQTHSSFRRGSGDGDGDIDEGGKRDERDWPHVWVETTFVLSAL